jgi:hypothetical protein
MENDIYDALNVISTLLWGALIVVAFLMACFLAWRAMLWLRTGETLTMERWRT